MSPFTTPFGNDLDVALRARFTLLVVVTREEERLLAHVKAVGEATRRPVVTWDVADGYSPPLGPKARDAMTALEQAEQAQDDTLVVLRDFHELWANPQVKRKLRNLAHRFRAGRKSIVVTTPAGRIPPELADAAVVLDLGLPGPEELGDLVDRFCATPGLRASLTPLGRQKLVAAAAGLSAVQVERELARALVRHGALDDRHIEAMSEAKKQLLRDHEALEYFPVSEGCDDVGGLDLLKDWLRLRERAFTPEAREYGLPVPRGIALLGIPGTGKSLTARIIAGLWRMPLIRLDVGALFGSLVGESEERVRRALRVAEAVAPCVLMIDEIDKAFAAGSGDGGTSARVLASLLTWMAEKQAPCFVVATANQIGALPPELLRRGRFDEVFFLDLPTLPERREIFRVHIARRRRLPEDFDLQALARASEGHVGAEIEQAVIDAMHVGFTAGRELTTTDIVTAVRRLVPLSASHREAVREMRTFLQQGRAQSATFREVQEAVGRFVPLDFDGLVKEN